MESSSEHPPTTSAEVSLLSHTSSSLISPRRTPPSLNAEPLPLVAHDRQIDTIIFDIGDVLFTWSADAGTSISPETLKRISHSATWFEYEKGNLSEEETYGLVAAEFSLDPSEVGNALRAIHNSLQCNTSMLSFLREVKRNTDIRLFAMSNISAPDWEALRYKGLPEDWALFDHVFASAAARERKPNFEYFRDVLESTGVDPCRTAFVDDRVENVISARSLGLKGIVFTSFNEVAPGLRSLVRNPVVYGEQYLRDHAKKMKSITETGVILEENLGQMFILEATGDPNLVDYVKYPRLSNFFKPGSTATLYPCDLDTTSIACTVSDHLSSDVKNDIMDQILTFKNKDGIIQTYFDATRPRIDPVVCVNVLTFFYANGRGRELQKTFDWVHAVLKHRAYANGTYYHGPDPFFYFLFRLLSVSPYARQRLGGLFAERVSEYFGSEGDAAALAMRIRAAAVVGLCDQRDYERLGKMQEPDGSWPLGWARKHGTTGILIGNTGLTTALAVSAMRKYRELQERRMSSFH